VDAFGGSPGLRFMALFWLRGGCGSALSGNDLQPRAAQLARGFTCPGFWEKYQFIAAGTARDRVLCMPVSATSG
jgi:hypothetical protein